VNQTIKRVCPKTKFSLEEVIAENPEYLLEQMRAELPKKPLRSGADMRINALKTLCDLLEKNFKKLDSIESQLFEIKSLVYPSTKYSKKKEVF
jgi:hypothetical protein